MTADSGQIGKKPKDEECSEPDMRSLYTMYLNFLNYLGNIKKIFPSTWYYQFLVILIGILGAMEVLATFACVMYMPVSDLKYLKLSFSSPSINFLTVFHQLFD